VSDHVLRPFRPHDASAIYQLHARHAAADLVDVCSTIDPPLESDDVRRRMAAAEWAVVVTDEAGSLTGWGSVRSWREDDGTLVYLTDGYVAPPARRRGLGSRLLREGEAAAAGLPPDGGVRGVVVLGGNASTVQQDRAALLEHNGYRHVLTMVDMQHDGRPVVPVRLPNGVAVRAATVADAQSLASLAARAWAGRPYSAVPAEEQFRDWLRRSDLSLFQVATVAERVVAFVAVTRTPIRVEVEDVTVHPDFQRRGLATAMLTRTLATVARQDAAPIRLHTEEHDPAGARSLYERLGFRVVRGYRRYRKSLAH
jgi:mycothiol synthase